MKLDIKKIPKGKLSPILADLPEELKNPDCYEEIEKKLFKAVFSDHSHPTVKAFVRCNRCQVKHQKKLALIKELGFKSVEQYMEWKKIMDIIYNKREINI